MRSIIILLSVLSGICLSTVVAASTVVGGGTVWEATDGDINTFNFNSTHSFKIFDDDNSGLNPSLGYLLLQDFDKLTVENLDTNWRMTNLAGDSLILTDSGYFRIGIYDGAGWAGDTSYIPYGGNSGYQLEFLGGAATLMVVDVQPVPVPAALYLMFSGMLGIAGLVRRRTRK